MDPRKTWFVAAVLALCLLAGARPASATCDICRYDTTGVKICQGVQDAPESQRGRLDCVDSSPKCFLPGECCYEFSDQKSYECTIQDPGGCGDRGCPTGKEILYQDWW